MGFNATIYRLDHARRRPGATIRPLVLGGTRNVRDRLRERLPGIYWSGYSGWIVGDGWRMEVSLWRRVAPATRGSVDSINVDATGEGDPLPSLFELCRANGWSLFDDSRGCFVDLDDPDSCPWEWVQWREAQVDPISGRAQRRRREIVIYDLDGFPDEQQAPLFRRYPVGRAEDVRERIELAVPLLSWHGRRGRGRSERWRLECHLKDTGLVDTFRFVVAGEGADELIQDLCEPNGWSAFDLATGEFVYLHETATETVTLDDIEAVVDNVIPFPGPRRLDG